MADCLTLELYSFKYYMIKKHIKSYKHAKEGFLELLTVENHNFIMELVFTGLVLIAGYVLNISKMEWLFIIFCCGLVLTTEIINTAIEAACDAIDLKENPQIKLAKDIAASAVVMTGITSFIIGLAIFLPRVIMLAENIN